MTCWFVATNSAVFGERQSSLPSESQIVVPLAVAVESTPADLLEEQTNS